MKPSAESGSSIVITQWRSDTLWRISKQYDTTPEAIQRANGLRSTEIFPGQLLKIPEGER